MIERSEVAFRKTEQKGEHDDAGSNESRRAGAGACRYEQRRQHQHTDHNRSAADSVGERNEGGQGESPDDPLSLASTD